MTYYKTFQITVRQLANIASKTTLKRFCDNLYLCLFVCQPLSLFGGMFLAYYVNLAISFVTIVLLLSTFKFYLKKEDLLLIAYLFINILYLIFYNDVHALSYTFSTSLLYLTYIWIAQKNLLFLYRLFSYRIPIFIFSSSVAYVVLDGFRATNADDQAFKGAIATLVYIEALFSIIFLIHFRQKINYLSLLALVIIGVLTESRGFFVGIVLFFLFLMFFDGKRHKGGILFRVLMAVLFLSFIAIISKSGIIDRLAESTSAIGQNVEQLSDHPDATRLTHYLVAFNMASSSLFGYGSDQFGHYYSEIINYDKHMSVHNFFLREYVAYGVFSLCLFTWFGCKIWRTRSLATYVPIMVAFMFSGGFGIYLFIFIALMVRFSENNISNN